MYYARKRPLYFIHFLGFSRNFSIISDFCLDKFGVKSKALFLENVVTWREGMYSRTTCMLLVCLMFFLAAFATSASAWNLAQAAFVEPKQEQTASAAVQPQANHQGQAREKDRQMPACRYGVQPDIRTWRACDMPAAF
jgi:hypothetical protein